jgi:hypothetical protein
MFEMDGVAKIFGGAVKLLHGCIPGYGWLAHHTSVGCRNSTKWGEGQDYRNRPNVANQMAAIDGRAIVLGFEVNNV